MDQEQKSPPEDREDQPINVPSWVVGTLTVLLAGVVGIIIYGYATRPGWVGVSGKKFWDYLELLIVPAAIAIGVAVLNWMQNARQHQADAVRERERQDEEARRAREREADEAQREREGAEVDRRTREREAQAAQRERELEVENRRAQDAALQAYFDQVSQLLMNTDMPLRDSKDAQALARARTLTVLTRIDPERKMSVLFLAESNLIDRSNLAIELDRANFSKIVVPVRIVLRNCRLQGVNLRGANFSNVRYMAGLDLSGAELHEATLAFTDMKEVILVTTHLDEADMRGAVLDGCNLTQAYLIEAKLFGAFLQDARLQGADLHDANLTAAHLNGANLSDAILDDANLTWADLTDATVTNEQLAMCKSLQHATMPNGQKYEEWLKSREGNGG